MTKGVFSWSGPEITQESTADDELMTDRLELVFHFASRRPPLEVAIMPGKPSNRFFGSFFRAPLRAMVLGPLAAASLMAGCKPPPSAAPSPPSAPSVAAPDASTKAAAATETTKDGFPTQLVQHVEELIHLTTQYNEMAAKITDVDAYKQQSDALAKLQEEISSHVEDIMIGEAKLTAAQKADFDRKYYEPRAKQVVEEQRRHKQRFEAHFR